MRITNVPLCVVAIALFAATAHATPISHEGFDYTLGQPLNTQAGGTGWGAEAWSAPASYSIVPGLTFSDYPVAGNAAEIYYPNSNNAQQVANRKVAGAANPTTLWRSYLYRPDSTVNNNYNGLQLNASTTNVGAAVLRSANRGWSHARGGVGVDNGVTWGTQDFIDGTTHLVISKFTGLTTASVAGKWWTLTPTQYDAIKAGGITEAELDATHYDTATDSFTFGSPLTIDNSKYVQMQYVTSPPTSQRVTYDEIRHGTDVADLFPGLPVPPPQPRTVQIDFDHGNTTPPGWNQAGINSTIPLLLDDTGVATDIRMTTLNEFGWTWSHTPSTQITAANGVIFPGEVARDLAGDNVPGGPRDGLGAIRLSTATQYEYEMTMLAASNDQPVDTLVNVGGTWDPNTKSFIGGQTLVLDTAAHDTGTMTATSWWDTTAGAYVLDLQMGNPVGGSTVSGLNGLHILAQPVQAEGDIPEPATLALLGLAVCGLGGYVRSSRVKSRGKRRRA